MLDQEVLQFIEENDVKFIRLAFTDLFGQLKNIAILPGQLQGALERGVPIDATAVDGCEDARGGDLLLRPDPDTLCMLPWRPQSGRVCRLLCSLLSPDGQPHPADSRALLKAVTRRAAEAGLEVRIGTDCEFYLLDLDEHGRVTLEPHDEGGYMDVAPLDRCEDVRRDIVLTLEQMNIRPESSHHERGPGQNEVDFHRAEPVTAADHYVSFLHAVRSVSRRYGVHATFLPKPLPHAVGNGLHVKLALYRDGRNLLRMQQGELTPEARSLMAGVLRRLPEMTLFLDPLPNSYDRLSAPDAICRVCWSMARDLSALRVPLLQDAFARMQLSSPDPTMNAYVGFALLIEAAMEGLRERLPLDDALRGAADTAPKLPQTMDDALTLARGSDFIARVLPAPMVRSYLSRAEALMQERARDPEAQTRAHILRF